jgi:hypothetical protein
MPFRRSRRCARGEWRRLGARKASPRVGPPTKAGGARRTPLFACAACANQRLAISTPRLQHTICGSGLDRENARPCLHLKPDPALSRLPTWLRPDRDKPSAERWPIAARPSAPPDLDASTETHYLWERSRPRTTLGPPPIEKPDPAQSFTPTEPMAPSRQTQRRTLPHRCSPISPTPSRRHD